MSRPRTSVKVFAGQLTGEALGLLRNIILARLLGPAEMGVCATLALTLSFLDMVSDLGPDRLLIQAPDGDTPEFQETAHTIVLSRGFLSGAIVMLLSGPLAHVLNVPEATWQFAGIGAILMLRGWQNLDIKRNQRQGEFNRQIVADLSAAVAATLCVILIGPHLRNSWSFLLAGMIQTAVLVVTSHVVAQRPYRWSYDRGLARRMFHFGWPLALNSALMFCAMQGDRLIVLKSASREDLGRYSVAIQLSLIPALLMSRVVSQLYLPLFSVVQLDRRLFDFRLRQEGTKLAALSLVFTLGFAIAGGFVLRWVYGVDYQVSPTLLLWLGVMQGVRVFRSLASVVAMSRADSVNPLIANLFRILGVLAALIVLWNGCGMEFIAACGAGGELLALCVSIFLLNRRHHVAIGPIWLTVFFYVAGTASFGIAWLDSGLSIMSRITLAGFTIALLGYLLQLAYRLSRTAPPLPVATTAQAIPQSSP